MTKLKKIFFWTITIVSILLLVFSAFYNAKPEWFAGLPSFLGLDSAAVSALVTSCGYGGTAGTIGFTVIKASLSTAIRNTDNLNASTINTVESLVTKVVDKAEEKYNELLKENLVQQEKIKELEECIKQSTETAARLSTEIDSLVEAIKVNLTKSLDNPLVNKESKKRLMDAYKNLKTTKEIISTEKGNQ